MIVLLGYMGSGKSLVSQYFSTTKAMSCVDLDNYIEQTELCSINDIFEKKGAIYFRKAERKALEEVIQDKKVDVLSLGGGTPCYYDNMDFMLAQPHAQSVYLHASIPELVKRLLPEMHSRPMLCDLRSHEELATFIGKHVFERSVFYDRAHFVIRTDGKEPSTIAREILSKLS